MTSKGNSRNLNPSSAMELVALDSDNTDILRQEKLFQELGLRHLGKLQLSAVRSNVFGYALIFSSTIVLIFFLYASYVSKLLPFSGIAVLDAIKSDHYFCYLMPLAILPTAIVLYINWLAMRHFEQN